MYMYIYIYIYIYIYVCVCVCVYNTPPPCPSQALQTDYLDLFMLHSVGQSPAKMDAILYQMHMFTCFIFACNVLEYIDQVCI